MKHNSIIISSRGKVFAGQIVIYKTDLQERIFVMAGGNITAVIK